VVSHASECVSCNEWGAADAMFAWNFMAGTWHLRVVQVPLSVRLGRSMVIR
jgi:hypothetical protein